MTIALIGMICLWSILPGPATLIILSDAWVHGKWSGLMTAAGGCSGVIVYVGIAFLQSMMFANVSTWGNQDMWILFLRIAGAATLAVLGLISLNEGVLKLIPSPNFSEVTLETATKPHGFASGFYLSLLSPQLALFYLVVVPQVGTNSFISGSSILLIGLFHVTFRTIWYGGLIHLTTNMQPYATGLFMQSSIKVIAGVLFLALSMNIII